MTTPINMQNNEDIDNASLSGCECKPVPGIINNVKKTCTNKCKNKKGVESDETETGS